MKYAFTILIVLFSLGSLSAQSFSVETWKDSVVRVELTDEEKREPAVNLKNYKFIDYRVGTTIFYTIHRHIKVNSDEAIEWFNKVYIPMYNVTDVLEFKVRTVSPGGEVINLDKSVMKDHTDENGYKYKIFALEGLQKGSEIEYYYTLRKERSYYGREFFQSTIYSRECRFMLICPKYSFFRAKSYNSLPQITDTTDADFNVLYMNAKNVPRVKQEKYSAHGPNLGRIDYHFMYNSNNYDPFYSWPKLAKYVAKNYFLAKGNELSRTKKLISQLKLKEMATEEQKIKAIEKYLKTNISLEKTEVANGISFILKNKYADEDGLIAVYSNVFRLLKIPFEIVYTNDRNDAKFDPDFNVYSQLRDVLFYFPGTGKYMAPAYFGLRYALPPAGCTNNYGVFIMREKQNGVVMGIPTTRFIEPVAYTTNVSKLDLAMQLDESLEKVKADALFSLSGYYGSDLYRLPLQKEADQQKTKEALFTGLVKDAEVKSVQVLNTDFTASTADSAYRVRGTFETSDLVEKSGKRILFKIGEAIGPQDQLYQEEERHTDIENSYNRLYDRTLTFTIPEGYIIKNLNDLKIEAVCKSDSTNQELFGFRSDFTVNGNQLKVTINEYYKQISLPKERFEDFRSVINAAADFNKVVLVLEKK